MPGLRGEGHLFTAHKVLAGGSVQQSKKACVIGVTEENAESGHRYSRKYVRLYVSVFTSM